MSLRCSGFGAGPLLALLAMSLTALQAQTTKVINVTDSRPLWAALDALETAVGGAINYEDPPYESEADVQDFSTPQQRAAAPASWRLVGPREGNVTAEIPVPAAGGAANSEIVFDVNLLLASYRQNKLPGDFKIEQANGMLYVTPARILGANGAMLDVTSPMTTVHPDSELRCERGARQGRAGEAIHTSWRRIAVVQAKLRPQTGLYADV